MNIDVLRAHDLEAADVSRWREIQASHPELANPFLSPGFTRAVAQVKPGVAVARLRQAGRIVGYFSFERGRWGMGRPIGAGVSDAQGVVCEPGFQWDGAALLADCDLAVIEFDHLVADQSGFERHVRRREPSPIIDLAAGYEAYVTARRSSRSFRRVLARGEALSAEHPSLRFDFHRADEPTLRTLFDWKSAQYRRTGRVDRFARPWIRGLVSALMTGEHEGCHGVLASLSVQGRPIALQACLASDRVVSLWFPAYDPGFERYSPGNVLRLALAEAAAARGIAWLDLGKGFSVHKEVLKTGELSVGEAQVRRRSAGAVLYRARHEPARRVERFVLDHPRLRVAARKTLVAIGSMRERG